MEYQSTVVKRIKYLETRLDAPLYQNGQVPAAARATAKTGGRMKGMLEAQARSDAGINRGWF